MQCQILFSVESGHRVDVMRSLVLWRVETTYMKCGPVFLGDILHVMSSFLCRVW